MQMALIKINVTIFLLIFDLFLYHIFDVLIKIFLFLYMSFEYNNDPAEENIPFPSEEATQQLMRHDLKSIFEMNNSQFIDNEISQIFEHIESTDAAVLDIIGEQMEKIDQMHSELMESTKRLFSALVNLKGLQMEMVAAKKQQTIQLLTKIGNTIHSISKIE